ncbi:MAG: hypothetical protein OMM_06676 [Candidatus Magnetoglobus multicellularis str. Araruama]|uniref:Uncharacterized protein n=1 Tax=Candidatus Magnetoglobus multicellularis str. Araruama TaxID=890399 RepID=A0A1V1PGH0_9BACT|nr:MAG: hypothetical protein OMM_06676 [Candidatus Magnetoglobus multicellularis str. Araruama]
MKTGIIIYVVAREKLPSIFNEVEATKQLQIKCDQVEFVTDNHYDISYALWKLIVKGMHRVICIFANYSDQSKFQKVGHEVQLCAY